MTAATESSTSWHMPALIILFYYLDKEHVQDHDLENFRCQRFCAADRQADSVFVSHARHHNPLLGIKLFDSKKHSSMIRVNT
jgi:hypothetical protein